jgi:hypothetical protein
MSVLSVRVSSWIPHFVHPIRFDPCCSSWWSKRKPFERPMWKLVIFWSYRIIYTSLNKKRPTQLHNELPWIHPKPSWLLFLHRTLADGVEINDEHPTKKEGEHPVPLSFCYGEKSERPIREDPLENTRTTILQTRNLQTAVVRKKTKQRLTKEKRDGNGMSNSRLVDQVG